MPPNMSDQRYARHLAYIGSINDDILNSEDIALQLIGELKEIAPNEFAEKYKLDSLDKTSLELFLVSRLGFLRAAKGIYNRGLSRVRNTRNHKS